MINYEDNTNTFRNQKENLTENCEKNGTYEKGMDTNESEVGDTNDDNTKNKGVWYNARTKCWLACVKGSGRHLRVFSVKKHGFKRAKMLAVECKNSTMINANSINSVTTTTQVDDNTCRNNNSSESTNTQSNDDYMKIKNEPKNNSVGRTRMHSYNDASRTHDTKIEMQESLDVKNLNTMNNENVNININTNGTDEGPDQKRRYNTRRGNYKSIEELNKKDEKNYNNDDDASISKTSNNGSVSPSNNRGHSSKGNYHTKSNTALRGNNNLKGNTTNKRNISLKGNNAVSPKNANNHLKEVGEISLTKGIHGKGTNTKGGGNNNIFKEHQINGHHHHLENTNYSALTRNCRSYHATNDRSSNLNLNGAEVKTFYEEKNQHMYVQNGKRQCEPIMDTLDNFQTDIRKKKKTIIDNFNYLVRNDNTNVSYHDTNRYNDQTNTSNHATHIAHNIRNSNIHTVNIVKNGQISQKWKNEQMNKIGHNNNNFQNVHLDKSAHNKHQHSHQNIHLQNHHNSNQHNHQNTHLQNHHNNNQHNHQNTHLQNHHNFSNVSNPFNARNYHNTRSSNNTCIITDKDFQIDSPEQTNEEFYFIKPTTYDYSENVPKQRNNKSTNYENDYNFVFSNDCYSDYCNNNQEDYKANFIDLTREALSLILQDLKKNVIPKIPVGIEKRERYTNSLRLCLKSAKFTKHINELEPYLELFSECIKNSKLPSHMDLKDQLFYLDKL
ncbi:transcription factor with AP2 domain(s) [Plasmodium gonderi]|uniref:Transcription factor with AP2 domain(S) n=1 Tax=Plasmodium gonderi TaxID=77519 RepID=A0A1Y1JP14_PLAGO|nr:transcription factor with AP2 domain(s) [Plasmodium gonderi]GAW82592.1 transcription factor with AP2 domain(s) [Plasmodium gonderi]